MVPGPQKPTHEMLCDVIAPNVVGKTLEGKFGIKSFTGSYFCGCDVEYTSTHRVLD